MRKITKILSIIVVVIAILVVLTLWYVYKSPSAIRPSNTACDIEFKLLECKYNTDTFKADVQLQLTKGKISGFNGILYFQPVNGVKTSINNQFLSMNEMETRNIQFDYRHAVISMEGPYKININPIPENKQSVCISGAEIACD